MANNQNGNNQTPETNNATSLSAVNPQTTTEEENTIPPNTNNLSQNTFAEASINREETTDRAEETNDDTKEILGAALRTTPVYLLIKHIKSTPDPEFPDDADLTTRLEAYSFNEVLKLNNISAREVSLWIIAESKKEISNTSPIFVTYKGIRAYSNKITRTRHHHNFLTKCVSNEWTPRGLSLQRRITPIGGNAQLEISIREIQFNAEKAILESLIFHYSELSVPTLVELEELEKRLTKSTSKYVNNVKCRTIVKTEELALSLRKKNTEKTESRPKRPAGNRKRKKNKQTSDTPKTQESAAE